MGFFRRQKKGALAAEHQKMLDDALAAAGHDPSMMAGAGMPGGMLGMLAAAEAGKRQAERYQRLHAAGVEMPGTVLAIRPAGDGHELRLSVEPPDAAPYEVTIRQALHESFQLQPGSRVRLRVEAGDPENVAIWGGDPAAAAAAPARDPLDALTELADRREQGLIGEAEYEEERTRLLGEL